MTTFLIIFISAVAALLGLKVFYFEKDEG